MTCKEVLPTGALLEDCADVEAIVLICQRIVHQTISFKLSVFGLIVFSLTIILCDVSLPLDALDEDGCEADEGNDTGNYDHILELYAPGLLVRLGFLCFSWLRFL